MFRRASLWVVLLFVTGNALAKSQSLIIIASIKPFYNLCASVMQSVGTPQLLLQHNASPHDYQLKPSDAQLINKADLVVWGGPGLEPYLEKPIANREKAQLDLTTVPDLSLLPLRHSVHWEAHEHGHDHDHDHGDFDPHYWLDPNNAILMANAIAARLAELDPAKANIYKQNAANFAKRINQKKSEWQQKLAPYKSKNFIVSHDAYQYFDQYFGLHGIGAITLNPEIPPSLHRVQQIQTMLKDQQVACIFSEPQFNFKIIDTLIAGTKVHKGQLDPLGRDQDLGPDGYFKLIDNLVLGFTDCYSNQVR